MSFRVDEVRVEIDVVVHFEPKYTIRFKYQPTEPIDADPLVSIAFAKYRELLDKEIAANAKQMDLDLT